jgi:hypothetical protein
LKTKIAYFSSHINLVDYNDGIVIVKYEVVGLAPGIFAKCLRLSFEMLNTGARVSQGTWKLSTNLLDLLQSIRGGSGLIFVGLGQAWASYVWLGFLRA